MKFLESKEISDQRGDVKVKFKPVTSDDQARILGYQGTIANAISNNDDGKNIQAQMRTSAYALKHMINEVKVKDEIIDHKEAGDCADLSDKETVNVLIAIYEMTVSLLVAGETKKKSSSPQSRTKKA
jgi:hypothetical protein